MPNRHLVTIICCLFWITCVPETMLGTPHDGAQFRSPLTPPRASYEINCRIDPVRGQLDGTEIVRIKNTTSDPIGHMAFDWALSGDQTLKITVGRKSARILADSGESKFTAPLVVELPEVVQTGESVELNIVFRKGFAAGQSNVTLTDWHPRLWWGFSTHDDYNVKLQVPKGYAIASSGRLDSESGSFRATGVRSFGVFLGKNLSALESKAGEVLVRCLYSAESEECARLIHATAVDAINFYQGRFGFYPQSSFTIVPGIERPVGGYPVATSIAAIHGMGRMKEKPDIHWKWITAHEIGHMYWGEYVMENESPGWLWIGMGIYADREYVRSKGLSLEKHRELMARYTNGLRNHLNTTVDLTPEQLRDVEFDYNNVVIHGKGFSIISALASTLGRDTFDRIYQRCLKDFGGRRMSVHDFQAVCESESQQDLKWFFDQWLRTNNYVSYQIVSQNTARHSDRFISRINVELLGTLKMPVPVIAHFEDGSQQRMVTDRLLNMNTLEFRSSSPLTGAKIDPDSELALIVPPPGAPPPKPRPCSEDDLRKRVRKLEWGGAGKEPSELFAAAQEIKTRNVDIWFKLGLTLYDTRFYSEALQAMVKTADLDSGYQFISFVWQGHLLDLLDRRAEALQRYRDALKLDGGTVHHSQFNMVIDKGWIEERIKSAFKRN